jgi:hypothetical protein
VWIITGVKKEKLVAGQNREEEHIGNAATQQ